MGKVTLADIIKAIDNKRVRITDHADEEMYNDKISLEEIYSTVRQGGIIEYYISGESYPRCLVYSETFNGDPIHTVWGYNFNNEWAVLITVYTPDENKWVDGRKRR